MKKILSLLLLLVVCITMVSCSNVSSIPTKYDYTEARIYSPSGSVQYYKIESYTIYADGELIEIVTTEGKVFLVNSENCVLFGEKEN